MADSLFPVPCSLWAMGSKKLHHITHEATPSELGVVLDSLCGLPGAVSLSLCCPLVRSSLCALSLCPSSVFSYFIVRSNFQWMETPR